MIKTDFKIVNNNGSTSIKNGFAFAVNNVVFAISKYNKMDGWVVTHLATGARLVSENSYMTKREAVFYATIFALSDNYKHHVFKMFRHLKKIRVNYPLNTDIINLVSNN